MYLNSTQNPKSNESIRELPKYIKSIEESPTYRFYIVLHFLLHQKNLRTTNSTTKKLKKLESLVLPRWEYVPHKNYSWAEKEKYLSPISLSKVNNAVLHVVLPYQVTDRKVDKIKIFFENLALLNDVPYTLEGLLKLTVITYNTACLILQYAWNRTPYIPMEVRSLNVLIRLGWLKTPIDPMQAHSLQERKSLSQSIESIFAAKSKNYIYPTMLTHGSTICRSMAPKCATCPISEVCASDTTRGHKIITHLDYAEKEEPEDPANKGQAEEKEELVVYKKIKVHRKKPSGNPKKATVEEVGEDSSASELLSSEEKNSDEADELL